MDVARPPVSRKLVSKPFMCAIIRSVLYLIFCQWAMTTSYFTINHFMDPRQLRPRAD
ncbi:hypothetical protein NC653_023715 [Populus alba x Populus x berolinensis]|uniref:Uncharacterized protein n=1 Tax=Populus alba x Populus x berolinensis TaxID=444605 RepID=A0AAD6QB10_9ROSI|nr:hypothetical protein NC653_023715 [Populus alba x Populus x berolinensis]